MPTPVRYPSGVASGPRGSALFNYPALDPFKALELKCDFTGLDYLATAWTVTETQAGATQALVASDTAGEHGLVALVNAAGAADINSIQLTTVPTIWTTGKKVWVKGRLSRDNADEAMGLGLQAVNATPFAVANGFFCHVAGASTSATFTVAKAGVLSTATVTLAYPTSALNTFVDLGMYYDGNLTVKCYVNDVHRADITVVPATHLPVVALTPTVSGQNTSANARTVHVDYVFASIER